MKWFWGSIFSILLGSPLYLPWLLTRFGHYKGWYLATFAPPLIWGRAIYAWPASALFVFAPFVGLLPLGEDMKMTVMAVIGIGGIVLAVFMIIWTPGWAKPKWQRYLEDNYSWREIRGVFIPAWRKMDHREWGKMMESEEGIEKLVAMARQDQSRI